MTMALIMTCLGIMAKGMVGIFIVILVRFIYFPYGSFN